MLAFNTDNHRKRPWRHTSSSTRENNDHEINATTGSGSAVTTSSVSAAGLENSNKDQSCNNHAPSSLWPVVCLTGFSPKEKDHYHKLIEDLGGRYTQDFNSSHNTHLVAKAAQGAKYEAAVKLMNHSSRSIAIVGSVWLKECHEHHTWIDPPLAHHHFTMDDTTIQKRTTAATATATDSKKAVDPDILIRSLKEQLEGGDDTTTATAIVPPQISLLFMDCQFLLIGFPPEERNLLTRLVGRGCGTIYWELVDSITHVIVKDDAGDAMLREAAEKISAQHPNAPVFVSPWWIRACFQHQALQNPCDFEPKYRLPPPTESLHKKLKSSSTNHPHATVGGSMVASSRNNTNKPPPPRGNLFRGCLFAFLRVSPPPGTVDYATNELELLISSQNGQLLSTPLVEALKVDHHSRNNASTNYSNNVDDGMPPKKKCCYVICWGGGGTDESVMMMHPLLAQVKRKELADIVPATPIWLQTCCTEQRIVPPQRLGILFQPTPWAIRSFPRQPHQQQQKATSSTCGGNKSDPAAAATDAAAGTTTLRISVSGFSGSRRTALIHLITTMGAVHDDSMRTSTTHLICRKSSGLKYQKAMEWKLHVVSMDWLYHVAQYGYKGKPQQQQQQQANDTATAKTTSGATNPSGAGCEARFSLTTAHSP